MKYKKLALIFVFILIICTGTGCAYPDQTVTKTDFYFDTVITITLYGTSNPAYIDKCFALAADYEKKFSNTVPDSEISAINSAAGKTEIPISHDTMELLSCGKKYGELSKGSFDITLGNLSDVWNFSEISNSLEGTDHSVDNHILPSPARLKEITEHINYEALILTDDTAYLSDSSAKLDLGGIAKGYIADQMKKYLNEQGITSGIINLGGNILTLGIKPDHRPYTIGIQRPFDETNASIASVKISDQSVVTSGVYERYYYIGQKLYHHILDVRTGYPYDNHLYSVTIISDSSMDGDALSTTCFTLGLDEGLAFIETLDDTEAIFITSDMEIHKTSGIGTDIPFEILPKSNKQVFLDKIKNDISQLLLFCIR